MASSLELAARDHGLDPSRLVTAVDGTTLPMWNAAALARATAVVRCSSTADVRAAVRIARDRDLAVSVFSGGNDWAGSSVREGALVVDVSAMDAIAVDTSTRTVRIGGGVRSDVLTRETEAAGLTPVGPTVGRVHMVGFTLGGGYGPLNGRFGLACDNLVAAEIVTAAGDVLTVDDDTEPDVLWALRGGGGNFGVVTSAVLRLHEVGPVHTGMIVYPWARATQVLTRLDAVLTSAPDELSVQTIVLTGADGLPVVAVAPTWSGPLDDGPAAVASLEDLGETLSVEVGPTPMHTVMSGMAASFPAGRHVRIRTRNVPAFTPGVIDRLVEAGSTRTSPLSALSIHPFHGAATRTPVGATAFGERRPHQMIEIVGIWEDDAGAVDARWADRVHASLAPDAMPGGYVNLLAADDHEAVQHAYGPNADRLLAIKRRVDPAGVLTGTPLPHPAG